MSFEIIIGQKSQYKVQTLLEYGQDDNIYRGQDLKSKLDVAIQIQAVNGSEQYKRQQKILQAIMAQGQQLKNVIQIFDFFELEDQGQRTLYIVMELAEADFRYLCRDIKYLHDEVYKVKLSYQIIFGVQELHKLEIAHNFISQENILCFSQESRDYILKFSDFKKAKQVNSNEIKSNIANEIVDSCFLNDIWSTIVRKYFRMNLQKLRKELKFSIQIKIGQKKQQRY